MQRTLYAAGRLVKANLTRLQVPLKLNWCLTYWCQYRCKTCNIWRRKPVDELTTAEALAFIDRNRETSWLDLTGGEITLRPDLPELVDAIAGQWRHLCLVHFPTNGFLTEKAVDAAARLSGIKGARTVVTVSLDGDEALNDEIRGIAGGYRRQVETFKALRRVRGVTVVFGITLSRFNAGRLSKTVDACSRDCPGLTLEDFHVNLAQSSGHYYANAEEGRLAPPLADARAELRRFHVQRGRSFGVAGWLERRFARELDRFLATGKSPMPCHALRSSCFIDPWGVVYPCITFDRPIGRLRDAGMSLAAIWNSADAIQTQAGIWKGNCPQCWTACEAYQSILGNALTHAARS